MSTETRHGLSLGVFFWVIEYVPSLDALADELDPRILPIVQRIQRATDLLLFRLVEPADDLNHLGHRELPVTPEVFTRKFDMAAAPDRAVALLDVELEVFELRLRLEEISDLLPVLLYRQVLVEMDGSSSSSLHYWPIAREFFIFFRTSRKSRAGPL